MTSIPSPLSVHLDCLPLHVTHQLYAAVLENPIILYAVENNPDFQTAPLAHNYMWLYHNYARFKVELTTTTTLPSFTVARWSNHLAAMWFEVVQLLVLGKFGEYIEQCVPTKLLQSILQTIFAILPPMWRDSCLKEDTTTIHGPTPSIIPTSLDSGTARYASSSELPVLSSPEVPTLPQSLRPVPPPVC